MANFFMNTGEIKTKEMIIEALKLLATKTAREENPKYKLEEIYSLIRKHEN